ncbi:protein kinase domain-containing protein [Archangium sp.]|uniref:nSTAND1 domain-containing NTPase n=1 Tax=Archangium sp. TaxID=1872627 RepID=UPI00286C1400|nr:protein kinase [Archangium sp.]
MAPFPPTHVGPYRLLHLLGSGGMASVYAAEHEPQGQRVALKLLSPAAAREPQLVARFLREVQALELLQHPGVVRVLHSAQQGGTAFFAMEYLEGLSLREWMRQQTGPTPLRVTLALGARIADIMAEVHAQEIVHRDLKPENIFLCPEEGGVSGYRVKLLDFGIAKMPPVEVDALGTTQVHTHESAFIGTYPYMAPEQFRSAASVAASADVYALGVVLFELLAGRTPFPSLDPVEVLVAHANEEPPPLRQFVPTLPGGLCAFIASMLAKEPARRPTMRRCHDMLGRPWEDDRETCPVPGLAPFTEAQAELFFGRDEELQALRALLGELHGGQRRWLQVEGPSGVGKSSLIQAGLLPQLTREPGWRVVCLRPGQEPIRALAQALASGPLLLAEGESAETVERTLRTGAGALRDFAIAHTPEGCRLLLVIEPLEELFTIGAAECLALDALLSATLEDSGSPVRLLTSVRADFLHRIEQVPTLARHLPRAARFPLLPMEPAALTQVVQGMALHAGLRLSEGLAQRMVQDARSEAGRLPLLGHALRGLWALSGGAPLTHAHYERLGGVGGALAQQAEALLDSLGTEGRESAKWMILSLVQIGRGVPDTRRPRSRHDVLAACGDDARSEEVLLRLSGLSTGDAEAPVGLRLLQLSGGASAAEQRVELVHELLLHRVRSIAAWIEQERTLLERRAHREAAAHAWHEAKCPVGGLPTGTLLAYYQGGATPAHASQAEGWEIPEVARFLQAARRLERRRIVNRALIAAAAGLALLAILFYAALASHAKRLAEESLRQHVHTMDKFAGDLDWKLSWLPYTLELRKAMLSGFRQALLELTPEQRESPKVRRVTIEVIHRQADLAFHDETLAEASRYLDEALAELRAALAESPEDGELLELLALNHSKRGKVEQARGHLDQACAHFAEAVRGLERPGVVSEATENGRRTLAVSDSELAECEFAAGRWNDAATLLDKSIELHEQNGESYNKALLAQVLGMRGDVARAAGKTDAARKFLARALRLGESSSREAPAGDQYSRWVLARVLVDVASFQATQGEREQAERNYKEASDLGAGLREGEPPSKRYALVWLRALAGQEALTGDRELATRLHTERCSLARDFKGRDGEDVRFLFADCP